MRIRIIDAFTDRPFAGNQAGVCVLPAGEWPDDSWLQSVAAELNLAETAFTRPAAAPDAWELRWFTPATEVRMCGHATLATAHALRSDGLLTDGRVGFTTLSGVLRAAVAEDGEITLDFPLSRPQLAEVPRGLVKALGVDPIEVHTTGDLGDLLVVLPTEADVRALTPDLAAVDELSRRDSLRGVIVTAQATEARTGGAEYDFVSRFFAPAVGIAEDPVTGSAHTALAPYWAGRLGRTELTGYQASPRGGLVKVAVAGDRVGLIGRAVTVVDGELTA